jgi:predicted phage gp36 major capsid-like protein
LRGRIPACSSLGERGRRVCAIPHSSAASETSDLDHRQSTPREDYDELRNTFEEFKSANDERIARIERGDVLLEEKVDRINQALDAQQRRSQAGARRRERRCRVSPEI